jgi:hypothetical protein
MLILGCLSRYHQTSNELNAALAEKQAEAARVDDLQIQSLRLAAQIERIKTDPKAVEALARQNLGFVRPGDIVLRIRPDVNSSEASVAASASPQQDAFGGPQNVGSAGRQMEQPAQTSHARGLSGTAANGPYVTAANGVSSTAANGPYVTAANGVSSTAANGLSATATAPKTFTAKTAPANPGTAVLAERVLP